MKNTLTKAYETLADDDKRAEYDKNPPLWHHYESGEKIQHSGFYTDPRINVHGQYTRPGTFQPYNPTGSATLSPPNEPVRPSSPTLPEPVQEHPVSSEESSGNSAETAIYMKKETSQELSEEEKKGAETPKIKQKEVIERSEEGQGIPNLFKEEDPQRRRKQKEAIESSEEGQGIRNLFKEEDPQQEKSTITGNDPAFNLQNQNNEPFNAFLKDGSKKLVAFAFFLFIILFIIFLVYNYIQKRRSTYS